MLMFDWGKHQLLEGCLWQSWKLRFRQPFLFTLVNESGREVQRSRSINNNMEG